MRPNPRFDFALAAGQAAEGTVWAIITELGDVTTEVKDQQRAMPEYGSVFIEHESRGKPSGIAITEADYWAIRYAPGRWVFIATDEMRDIWRKWLDIRGPSTGGDDHTSVGAVVPLVAFINP